MAPLPQENVTVNEPKKESLSSSRPLTGDEVVISGMSGIYPMSNSTKEFMENLYNKVDMVSDKINRWEFTHPELPKHLGMVKDMAKFDAQFFRVHYKQACTMEPMSRKLLEHAYSAIFDSGINPLQLRGKKVGVFIGATFSESEKIVIYETIQRNGFGITGCNRSMYANRISYWIDGKGPSYALDSACASSMACLEHAYRSISTGQCDAAIIGGCNLCMHPSVSLNMSRAGFLCLDGKTKVFDKHGDGYVRADAMCTLFLQKAKDANRIYSEVYYAKATYTQAPNPQFLPIRESEEIEKFLNQFYSEINISPSDVEYIEANGAAMAKADGNELDAIGKVFAKDKIIKVGCVKSNMGHSEPASGACALTKVCLAYHKGKLPANLHYNEPQDHIPAIREGRIEVLKDHSTFNRGFAALNAFSYSGSNIHVLLKGHYKPKNLDKYKTSLPRIVLASGRQESCVKSIIEYLEKEPVDAEIIGMLLNIHKYEIPGHMCRGYVILDTNEQNETVCLSKETTYFSGTTRPLWFVYSGMGSQWMGMGAELMKIPVFSAAIQRCHKVLEPKGIDIVRILTEPDKDIYNNILNSFVGIAAVQIGLTDVLSALGIVPDNLIGHSVGELGCAYADGCFTAEEMILAAYSRGLVSLQTELIRGSMAAVGLGYEKVKDILPPQIEVACHNSSESSTISGPADIMKEFVAELAAKGIFAKEVPCSNIAYHSRYIADAGPGLLKYLNEVIKDPKPRSEKWVSTSVPQDKWDQPLAELSSAEYHTNNLLSPVLFEETAKLIPENAILIEVAPHGLLQAILKRSLAECVHVPLTRRGHSNPIQFFLEALGKLYVEGFHPQVDILYPTIQYPVSTETGLLAQLVEWEHSEDWPEAKYNVKERINTTRRSLVISIHDDDFDYLENYVRDGFIVLPEAAQIVLIWETLAMHKGSLFTDYPVKFTNISFHNEAHVQKDKPFTLTFMILKGNNNFEVSHNGIKITSGVIEELDKKDKKESKTATNEILGDIVLNTEDVYRILQLRGHSYSDSFQTIQSINSEYDAAQIGWNNEWVAFLDSMMQLNMLAKGHNGVSVPKLIKKLTIDTEQFKNELEVNKNILKAEYNKMSHVTSCAGVEFTSIEFFEQPKFEGDANVLINGSFIPHFVPGEVDTEAALLINLQIVSDNVKKNNVNVVDIATDAAYITAKIRNVVDKIPTVEFDIKTVTDTTAYNNANIVGKADLLLINGLLGNAKKMKTVYNILPNSCFILSNEEISTAVDEFDQYFNVISSMTIGNQIITLLNRANVQQQENITYMPIVHDIKFSWLQKVISELQNPRRLVLVSEKQPYCGLIGMIKRLNIEFDNKVGLVMIDDINTPSFNPQDEFYKKQLQKNLTINVFKKGQWGGYYNLPTSQITTIGNIKLTSVPGHIDSLKWEEIPVTSSKTTTVQVHYAGPTFRDAQIAVGKVKSRYNGYGQDFSGLNNKRERVMGLLSGGAIASTVEADTDLLWPVPEYWSLEDAATVPLAYTHAYYCLAIKSGGLRNQKIFIMGGCGAFGQALISISLYLKWTVYTTVRDMEKKQFLLKMYPDLEAKNIGSSYDDTFYTMVIENTKTTATGVGCNYVINCLSGDMRTAAMKCVGFAGIFLDVGETDMVNNADFGMFYLCAEKNYVSVNLSNIFRPDNVMERKILQLYVSQGIQLGFVRPLSRVVYNPNDITKAFRLLSSSKHRGKVLIRLSDSAGTKLDFNIRPRIAYSRTNIYVVVCDETEFGVELVDRIVNNGAKKVVINLPNVALNAYFFTKLTSWKQNKASIIISKDNLQTEKGCINLFNEAANLGLIDTIFMVQNSKQVNENINQGNITENFNKTALVVGNLDKISRNMCPTLSNFVVLMESPKSLVSEYTTSVADRICLSRTEVGLPAISLKYWWSNEKKQYRQVQSKIQPQKLQTIFNSMEVCIKLGYNNVISFDLRKNVMTDFLQKVARILDIQSINNIQENVALNALGLNEVKIEELKVLLKNTQQIDYSANMILDMTINSFKQLNELTHVSKSINGLDAFYTFIDQDECMATEPMVTMPTKLSSATDEREEELDPKANYLMLIPGFEGHQQIFTSICKSLKIQAMTFQLGPDINTDSIREIAVGLMKFIKKRFELKSKFYILGYSFGVNVALELAALMEDEGHVGVVYCLDSSPDILRVQIDAFVGNLSDTELQNAIVKHMFHLMTAENSKELIEDLKRLETWPDKVEACVSRLRGVVSYSNQYKRSILETAYKRIQLARTYKPDLKLNSEIILMKGIPHPLAQNLPQDYNLSTYSYKPVVVYDLETEHPLTPFDSRVSNIVNKMLEPQVVEEFKCKNLCESYLADSVKSW